MNRNNVGLKYFLFRTNFFEDIKVKKLNAITHGANTVGIYVGILCYLFHEGYYIRWNEDTITKITCALGFCKSQDVINTVLSAVDCGLIDSRLFYEANIVTSKEIQECYITSSASKKKNKIQEFSLLDKSL